MKTFKHTTYKQVGGVSVLRIKNFIFNGIHHKANARFCSNFSSKLSRHPATVRTLTNILSGIYLSDAVFVIMILKKNVYRSVFARHTIYL